MALAPLLYARSEADFEAARPGATSKLETLFPPGDWGLDIYFEPYTEANVGNLWNNEFNASMRAAFADSGKSESDFKAWLQEVHFVGVNVYWKHLFETYKRNVGWRLLLFSVPAAEVATVGLASHYQQAQRHNQLAKVSNLLFDQATDGLAAAGSGQPLPGRKVAPDDWDKDGLMPHPIADVAGVDVSTAHGGRGLFIKEVRSTTVKKIIASLITVTPLDPTNAETQLDDVLGQYATLLPVLAGQVYPFNHLGEFERVRALGLNDLAAASLQFQLRRTSTSRSAVRVYYGPPGTGKTLAAVRDAVELADPAFDHGGDFRKCFERFSQLREQVAFLTFHQSLQYEDVVESIRPVLKSEPTTEEESGEDGGGEEEKEAKDSAPESSEVEYYLYEGPFLRMARQAAENPDREFVIVIDEINRGDLSRILGPIISALEPDKRAGAEFPIGFESQYPRAKELETRIFLPANLHIIGTMNSADRNIALVDYALRRRFDFVEVPPEEGLLSSTKDDPSIDIRRLLSKLNERIRYLLDRDHCIGHGYFMACESNRDVIDVFARKILPLLSEYFYGNEANLLLTVGDTVDGQLNIHRVERAESAFEAVFDVDVDTAVELGYREQETRVAITIDTRFWNPNRLVPGPDDESYAVKALRKIYEPEAVGGEGAEPPAESVSATAEAEGDASTIAET